MGPIPELELEACDDIRVVEDKVKSLDFGKGAGELPNTGKVPAAVGLCPGVIDVFQGDPLGRGAGDGLGGLEEMSETVDRVCEDPVCRSRTELNGVPSLGEPRT